MVTQFFTIAVLMLLASMMPGPDFLIVTKNTVGHTRREGLLTTLGVCCGTLVHITYCALGLAIIISQSQWVFNIIKYVGGAYLVYLGVNALLAKQKNLLSLANPQEKVPVLSDFAAFRQGLYCNLLNPKASLFYLSVFTVLIKPATPTNWVIIYGLEMFSIKLAWFCTLTIILSHPAILTTLNYIEHYISKALGVFLIGLGILLTLVKQ